MYSGGWDEYLNIFKERRQEENNRVREHVSKST